MARFRLVDTAGGEIGIVESEMAEFEAGDTVRTPDGREVEVVEIYDDEAGQEGGVEATLVVDEGGDSGEPSPEQRAAFLDFVDRLGLGAHRDEIEKLVQRAREEQAPADDQPASPP